MRLRYTLYRSFLSVLGLDNDVDDDDDLQTNHD